MRSGVLVLAALGLGACNWAFGLSPTKAVDAVEAADADPDMDHDGVDDVVDVCPMAADPGQHDEDHDGMGDACDPCPLDPNTSGDDDGDGIHNLCDPFPAEGGDCLELFDSFQSFSVTNWVTVPGTTLAAIPEGVRLTIAVGSRAGFGPKDNTGLLSMRVRFSAVQIGSSVRVMARSDPNNTSDGFSCSIDASSLSLENVIFGPPPMMSISPPLTGGDSITVGISHHGVPAKVGCVVIAPGAQVAMEQMIQVNPNGDRPMIVGIGSGTDLSISALAIYGRRLACQPSVIR